MKTDTFYMFNSYDFGLMTFSEHKGDEVDTLFYILPFDPLPGIDGCDWVINIKQGEEDKAFIIFEEYGADFTPEKFVYSNDFALGLVDFMGRFNDARANLAYGALYNKSALRDSGDTTSFSKESINEVLVGLKANSRYPISQRWVPSADRAQAVSLTVNTYTENAAKILIAFSGRISDVDWSSHLTSRIHTEHEGIFSAMRLDLFNDTLHFYHSSPSLGLTHLNHLNDVNDIDVSIAADIKANRAPTLPDGPRGEKPSYYWLYIAELLKQAQSVTLHVSDNAHLHLEVEGQVNQPLIKVPHVWFCRLFPNDVRLTVQMHPGSKCAVIDLVKLTEKILPFMSTRVRSHIDKIIITSGNDVFKQTSATMIKAMLTPYEQIP